MQEIVSSEQLVSNIFDQFEETLASGCLDIQQRSVIYSHKKDEANFTEDSLLEFVSNVISKISDHEPVGFLFVTEFENGNVLFIKKISNGRYLFVYTQKAVFPLLNLYLRNIDYQPQQDQSATKVKKEFVPEKIKAEEEEDEHPREELEAARRIQQIMLTDPSILAEAFSSHFLYYSPQDVIGGDFYIFKKFGRDYILIVADCTGHSVEGALASMTVASILNQHVTHFNVDLSLVFNTLYNQLGDYNLNSENASYGIGVELAMVKYHAATAEMEVGTSGVPVLHGNGDSFRLIKHRKLRQMEDQSFGFSVDRFEVKAGDHVFLFTDGVMDQFDNEDKHKLGSKGVERLIAGMNQFDAKAFARQFEAWKGKTRQIDDVTLLGLRI